jgi:asparagine synthase (glutamine-hydrolysing)
MTTRRLLTASLRTLGAARLTWRIAYEIARNAKILEAIEPGPAPWPNPSQAPDLATWHRQLDQHIGWLPELSSWLRDGSLRDALLTAHDAPTRARIHARALDATRGTIHAFGVLPLHFGSPLDWHQSWPPHVHHTQALSHAATCGDIKLVWELGRQPHVFDWLRAHAIGALSHQETSLALATSIDSFHRQNPWRLGVHWASGQEIAIRTITWLWATAALGPDALPDPTWRRLISICHASALHLERHLSFAKWAVPNNHLLAESLAIRLLGALLHWLPDATRWRRLGALTFARALHDQFLPQGGYLQSSHTYHQLALDLLIWATRLFAPIDAHLAALSSLILTESIPYIEDQLDWSTGHMPRWGADDGALLNPWTEQPRRDRRPLLATLYAATHQPSLLPPGPWDEAPLWLFGPKKIFINNKIKLYNNKDIKKIRIYRAAGIGVIRRGESFVVMSCGEKRLPFGQSECGHVSLWLRGREVVTDAGTYRYNDAARWHDWFHGPNSHNAPRLDGPDDGYLRLGQFSWVEAPRGAMTERTDGLIGAWRGGHVSWRREVSWLGDEGGWRIVDEGRGERLIGRCVRLHWLLVGVDWGGDEQRCVLRAPSGERIEVRAEGASMSWEVCVGEDSGARVEGWVATGYGAKEPATSLIVWLIPRSATVRLTTLIS